MTVVASNPLFPSFLLYWCSVAAAPGKQAIKIHVFKLLGASVQSKKQEATGFLKDAQASPRGRNAHLATSIRVFKILGVTPPPLPLPLPQPSVPLFLALHQQAALIFNDARQLKYMYFSC